MKQETFQKALMATARITCCASIFGLGCQAEWIDTKAGTDTTDSDVEDTEEESNNTDTASNEDTSDPSDSGTTVDTGGGDTNDTQDTQDSGTQTDPVYDEECEELITSAFPDPNGWEDPNTIDQAVKDCCQLAAEYYDATALQSDGTFDWAVIDGWEYRNQCCNALEWQSDTMACTPWGPPMPPKFRAAKIHRPQQLQRILVRHA